MAIRTIPTIFPNILPSEIAVGRALKSDVFRRFAQAQNYLWSNIRRAYAFWAYDGEGNFAAGSTIAETHDRESVLGREDPMIVDMPGGNYRGLCVATFRIPPPPVGNTAARFQGRASYTEEAGGTAVIRVTLHELDAAETYTGIYAEDTLGTTDTAWDWSLEVGIPSNRPMVGKLWIGGTLTWAPAAGGGLTHYDPGAADEDVLLIYSVSGRWLPPAEFPTVGLLPFEPTAIDNSTCVDVAILDQVRRQLVSLAGSRGQLEILQTWLHYAVGSVSTSFEEVGRYVIYISAAVTEITVRITALRTEVDDAEIQIKIDGSVEATITANYTQYEAGNYEVTIAVTGDMEVTLTVEARLTVALGAGPFVGDSVQGIEVLGVFAYESAVDQTGWIETGPTDFSPLDENRLKANDIVSVELEAVEGARTGLLSLLNNNLWLAKHRLRSLVGDWRRRTYKRIDDDSGTAVFGADPGAFWDWTRGIEAVAWRLLKGKNITVRGDGVTDDGWGRAAAGHNNLDGYGRAPHGYSDTGGGGSASVWPSTQTYRGHGRRLSAIYCGVPTGYQFHATDGTATSTMHARARRLRPALFGTTFDGGTLGPALEEPNWVNRGSLEVDWPSTGGLSFPIRSSAPAVVDDHQLRWLSAQSKLSYVGEGTVRGRLPIKWIPIDTANTLEGTLFEIELTALLVMDDPLPATSLALLA